MHRCTSIPVKVQASSYSISLDGGGATSYLRHKDVEADGGQACWVVGFSRLLGRRVVVFRLDCAKSKVEGFAKAAFPLTRQSGTPGSSGSGSWPKGAETSGGA